MVHMSYKGRYGSLVHDRGAGGGEGKKKSKFVWGHLPIIDNKSCLYDENQFRNHVMSHIEVKRYRHQKQQF